MLFFTLMRESVKVALTSLRTDRFRSALSLSGVAVGVFCVVAVMCVVSALERNISRSLTAVGGNLLIVDVYPWEEEISGEELPLWEYLKRPEPSYEDYRFIRNACPAAEDVVFMLRKEGSLRLGTAQMDNVEMIGATDGMGSLMKAPLLAGRHLSPAETGGERNICLIGAETALKLLGTEEAVGRKIQVCGVWLEVVGVFARQGRATASVVDTDCCLLTGYATARRLFPSPSSMLVLSLASGEDMSSLKAQVSTLLRSARRLGPADEDNFALNEVSSLTGALDSLLSTLSRVGLLIGCFSLLIGGFGIANIMFVSVRERTAEIGIQKSLGAKRWVIMLQYVVEGSVISVAGGLVGVAALTLAGLLMPEMMGMRFLMSVPVALKGLALALCLGLVFSLIPAYTASRLSPVEAING